MAFLGLSFVACALMIAGLPPLSGFLAKFAMLAALLDTGSRRRGDGPMPALDAHHCSFCVLIVSGLLSTIALSRAGDSLFLGAARIVRRRICGSIECAPIAALLLRAPCSQFARSPCCATRGDAAQGLLDPAHYIDAVMSATPTPGPAAADPSRSARRSDEAHCSPRR